MRNLRLFKTAFLLASFALLVNSCAKKKQSGPVISGIDAEILNLSDSTIHFYSVVPPLDQIKGKSPKFEISITVDSNGIFARPIEVTDGYYYFEFDQNKVLYFVQVGKKLSLDFDATKPYEKPDYSGKLKYESRYLFDRYLAQANFIANENTFFEYGEDAFVETVELMRGKMDTMLVMYIANHPTGSPKFMQQESLTNLYFMAAYLEAYPIKRTGTDTLVTSYFTDGKELNINDTNAFENPEFYTFIQNYVWRRTGLPTNKPNVLAQLALEDQVFTVTEYKDYLRFKAAKEVVKWDATNDRKMVLDTLQSLIVNDEIRQFLTKSIQNDTTQIPNPENVILEDQ